MSFAQKDRLDRIQHTLLLTTEKNFIENERKMPIFDRHFLLVRPHYCVVAPNFQISHV